MLLAHTALCNTHSSACPQTTAPYLNHGLHHQNNLSFIAVVGYLWILLSQCLSVGSMGFDRLDTAWGAWDLTLSDTAAVQGAQSALGLLGLITPLWLSMF